MDFGTEVIKFVSAADWNLITPRGSEQTYQHVRTKQLEALAIAYQQTSRLDNWDRSAGTKGKIGPRQLSWSNLGYVFLLK